MAKNDEEIANVLNFILTTATKTQLKPTLKGVHLQSVQLLKHCIIE